MASRNLTDVTSNLTIVALLVSCGTGCFSYKAHGYCQCEWEEDSIVIHLTPIEREVCLPDQDEAEAEVQEQLKNECDSLNGTLINCSYKTTEVWSCSGDLVGDTQRQARKLIPIPDPKFNPKRR